MSAACANGANAKPADVASRNPFLFMFAPIEKRSDGRIFGATEQDKGTMINLLTPYASILPRMCVQNATARTNESRNFPVSRDKWFPVAVDSHSVSKASAGCDGLVTAGVSRKTGEAVLWTRSTRQNQWSTFLFNPAARAARSKPGDCCPPRR